MSNEATLNQLMTQAETEKERKAVFLECYHHTLQHLGTDDDRAAIDTFIASLTMMRSTYMSVSADGIKELAREVFGRNSIRDFVLELTYQFMSRYVQNPETYAVLIQSLTMGATLLNADADYDFVPRVIRERTTSQADLRNILNYNSWLVTVLLIKLYVTLLPTKAVSKNG